MANELPQVSAPVDVDAEYRFGQPKTYLTPLELTRLMIARSRLGETRAEREAERIRSPRSRRR